jgi:protein-S-isoprenylcysteine O-methyltransferase Ste14
LNVLGGTAFVGVVGVILFCAAGRWDVWFFWVYMGLLELACAAGGLLADPSLARERIRPGPGGKDYFIAIFLMPLWVGQFVVAGLDVGRFRWTADFLPLALVIVGLVLVAAGWGIVTWAVVVNRFFSSVVRIQRDRGHHVITTGPYHYVRHPGYAAALLLFPCSGWALGSWLAFLIGLVLTLPIIRRTIIEDRTLREQLEGYGQYAEKVRYRLLPGVW